MIPKCDHHWVKLAPGDVHVSWICSKCGATDPNAVWAEESPCFREDRLWFDWRSKDGAVEFLVYNGRDFVCQVPSVQQAVRVMQLAAPAPRPLTNEEELVWKSFVGIGHRGEKT